MYSQTPTFDTSFADYRISDLDDILNRVAHSLQLDATRHQLANDRYKAVAEWIENDPAFFKTALIRVYAQGSFRIRTTVKPFGRNEFDLDFVVHLDFLSGKNYDAMYVLGQLERRLREHGTYRTMMERKNRCIRLTYANDFHMDILVGCQEDYYEKERIIVPDRQTRDWTPSNPLGYADWFWLRTRLAPAQFELLRKAHSQRNLELRASDDLPAAVPYELKPPLERAVQILKRYRDVYFQHQPDLAVSSIILTTLAGYAYAGQLSIYETIDGIIAYIEQQAGHWSGSRTFQILNPANLAENFSEKWEKDPQLFRAFTRFVTNLRDTWSRLKTASTTLRDSELERIFGDERVRRLLKEQRNYEELRRKAEDHRALIALKAAGTLYTTADAKPSAQPTSVHNIANRNYGGTAMIFSDKPFVGGTNYLQKRWVEQTYPGVFQCRVKGTTLICEGTLQPTKHCAAYRVRIEYTPGHPPQVFLLNPQVRPNKKIHVYRNGALCLFFPPDMPWHYRTSVAAVTVPWIVEWIVAYELWKVTGKWEAPEVIH